MCLYKSGAGYRMTKKERTREAALHHSTDIIPWQLDVVEAVSDRLVRYYGREDYDYEIVGNHIVRIKYKNHRIIDSLHYEDIFGVVWRRDKYMGNIGSIKDITFKEPVLPPEFDPKSDPELVGKLCRKACERYPDRFIIFEIGFSYFERAWSLRGMENILTDFLLEPAFADALFEKLLAYNLEIIKEAAKYDIDCIMLGDDWGQQRGLIMGKPLWDRFIRPGVKKMYDAIKSHGLFTAQHSCGDNRELLCELCSMGLDIYNTFQPEIYDVEQFARDFGGYLTIYGGVSTQGVLTRGTPTDVREQTLRNMELLGKYGYIVAPTHQITSDAPPENILAFVETVTNQ